MTESTSAEHGDHRQWRDAVLNRIQEISGPIFSDVPWSSDPTIASAWQADPVRVMRQWIDAGRAPNYHPHVQLVALVAGDAVGIEYAALLVIACTIREEAGGW